MMKAVIFKQPYKNYKIGDVYIVDESFKIDSWISEQPLFKNGYIVAENIPATIPKNYLKPENLEGTLSPYRAESWSKNGQILYQNPNDETWTYDPGKSEFWQIGFKPGFKEPIIAQRYQEMVADVYAQMYVTFGTQDPDSASAYKETWDMMIQSPSSWVSAGLTARFDRGGLSLGDPLDTEQKIVDYATECNNAAITYGIWRMQRIEQFRQERASILAGS